MPLQIANVENGKYNLVVQAENTGKAKKEIDIWCLEQKHCPISINLTKADFKYVLGSEQYKKSKQFENKSKTK